MRRAKIASLATYVPPRVLTNKDLEEMVDTDDEWILQRTGIRTRHIVEPGMATSDLAREAALEALARAGVAPSEVGVIIVGTTTPDMFFPSTACLVQHAIGATNAWGFDLAGACSGFNYSLSVGAQMVASGAHDCALVIGADVMSSIIDYTDRATCILFGDGAGAVVLTATDNPDEGILDWQHQVDGSGGASLCMPAGGSRMPASLDTVERRLHYVKQDGQAVFKFAVKNTEDMCRRVLDKNGVDPHEVDLFVSHQANRRIIMSAAERLGLDLSKVMINIEEYGNTTAGTIPLALNDAILQGRLKKGTSCCSRRSARGSRWDRCCCGGPTERAALNRSCVLRSWYLVRAAFFVRGSRTANHERCTDEQLERTKNQGPRTRNEVLGSPHTNPSNPHTGMASQSGRLFSSYTSS
jgi:3-oxoacyl-[acyl-carrier-protein] synthase-3